MRGDATYTLDVDFGEASTWGVQRYFEEQLACFDRFLPDDATGQPRRRGAGADLRHGRRQRPQDRGRQARPRRRTGATSRSGRSRAPCRRRSTCAATARSRREAAATTSRARFTYDPEDPVPTIGGNYCAVGEIPAAGRGDGADVDAAAQPGAPAAQHHDPGPRRPGGVRGVLHGEACRAAARPSAPTCSSTRPSRSRSRVEVTGRGDGEAAHRVERGRHRLHGEADRRLPAERGLPRGLRHADQRLDHPHAATATASSSEELMEPGTRYEVTILLPPTSNVFAAGPPDPRRRVVVELPAARAQPEHGRADRPAHAHGQGRPDGVLGRGRSRSCR